MKKIMLLILNISFSIGVFGQKENMQNELNKWLLATINIEARSDSSAGSGTAIYLKHNDEYYLLTARHVVEDTHPTIYSRRIIPNSTRNTIAKKILIVENLNQLGTNKIEYDQFGNVYETGDENIVIMGLGTGIVDKFIFSSKDIDLAIINLSLEYQDVINTLNKRGYIPITINDIDTSGFTLDGEDVFAIGFPTESTVARYEPSPISNWRSEAVSLPIVSMGKTKISNHTNFLEASIFVYHGYSGGPLIRNNKLVGVVHGGPYEEKKIDSPKLPRYLLHHILFVKAKFIPNLLNEIEAMIKFKRNQRKQ